METPRADGVVQTVLQNFCGQLADQLEADVMAVITPMTQPWDDLVRQAVEQIAGERTTDPVQRRLAVILETGGGYIESVERMVRAMRTHYDDVIFVIPNFAYSAGTVLALSGDDIYMDYHSVLGPIDPQFTSSNGSDYVPGMGYLAKYQELVEVINAADNPSNVRAEISYLIEKFDPAKLFHIEQAIEHSKSLLREWLPRYKFKNWITRETTGGEVSAEDKQQRANEIAQILGDARRWHSHGRGISYDTLSSEEIKLKINNYDNSPELKSAIRNYHGLLVDYMGRRGMPSAIHTLGGFRLP